MTRNGITNDRIFHLKKKLNQIKKYWKNIMFLVIKTTTDQNTYIGSVSWDLKTRVECKEKLPAEYIFNYYHCWSVNNQQSKLGCQTQTIHGHGQIGAIHVIKLAGNLKVTQIHKEPITVIHRLQIGPKVEPPLASSLAQMNCKICVFLQSLSCIINLVKYLADTSSPVRLCSESLMFYWTPAPAVEGTVLPGNCCGFTWAVAGLPTLWLLLGCLLSRGLPERKTTDIVRRKQK